MNTTASIKVYFSAKNIRRVAVSAVPDYVQFVKFVQEGFGDYDKHYKLLEASYEEDGEKCIVDSEITYSCAINSQPNLKFDIDLVEKKMGHEEEKKSILVALPDVTNQQVEKVETGFPTSLASTGSTASAASFALPKYRIGQKVQSLLSPCSSSPCDKFWYSAIIESYDPNSKMYGLFWFVQNCRNWTVKEEEIKAVTKFEVGDVVHDLARPTVLLKIQGSQTVNTEEQYHVVDFITGATVCKTVLERHLELAHFYHSGDLVVSFTNENKRICSYEPLSKKYVVTSHVNGKIDPYLRFSFLSKDEIRGYCLPKLTYKQLFAALSVVFARFKSQSNRTYWSKHDFIQFFYSLPTVVLNKVCVYTHISEMFYRISSTIDQKPVLCLEDFVDYYVRQVNDFANSVTVWSDLFAQGFNTQLLYKKPEYKEGDLVLTKTNQTTVWAPVGPAAVVPKPVGLVCQVEKLDEGKATVSVQGATNGLVGKYEFKVEDLSPYVFGCQHCFRGKMTLNQPVVCICNGKTFVI